MIDPTPAPLLPGVNAVIGPMLPVASRAALASIGGIGGILTALLLLMSIAANSGNEAERITDLRGDGYAPRLAAALAVDLSKPLR